MSSFYQTGMAGLMLFCLVLATSGAEKNSPADPASKPEETSEAQQTLRSYLQLQEQLHNTLLTIERTRKEADTAAKASADAVALRLEGIEQTLSAQQKQEADLLRNSNRITLISAGVFAGLGLLAMVFTAWFLLRAMNRLATVVAAFPAGRALGQGQATQLVATDLPGISLDSVEPSSNRLLGVIERLEKRVHELEHTSHLSLTAEQGAHPNGSGNGSDDPGAYVVLEADSRTTPTAELMPSRADPSDRISVILGKGQALLSLDKPEEAIACFDEALALEPRHAEALVKRGTALERLKRLEEAIECYDRAIAANRFMTLAYLYKGGVCNQLERFSEALECYEQALRSQQKVPVPAET
jgi:tetratricopeptide (TPR) repeat protein